MEDQSRKQLPNIGSQLYHWAFVASFLIWSLLLHRFGRKVVYESLWDMGARQYRRGADAE
jgi:hypothetical protein